MKIAVIGAGIIGSTLSLALARRGVGPITVFEKEPEAGCHSSGRNSGVIHSGINQKPGSLKARFCVEGSRLLREFCRAHSVPMKECGTLVVATESREIPVLERLMEWGNACGVTGLRRIKGPELQRVEPLVAASDAVHSPTGAIVDSLALLNAVVGEARRSGVDFRFSQKITGIQGTTLLMETGEYACDYVINCAGLYADKVAHWCGIGRDTTIIPFRGEYMEVRDCPVNGMIYRAPDLRFPFLSIHFTREMDGHVLAGPSAVLSFGRESYQKEFHLAETLGMIFSRPFLSLLGSLEFWGLAIENAKTSISKHAFLREMRRLIPSVTLRQMTPAKAGIRAQLVSSRGKFLFDMLVEHGEKSTHVLNAVSPGMTCSLAFAEYLTDEIVKRLAKQF